MSEKTLNLYQKLVEVKKAVEYLKKEARGHQYNYVGSSHVLGAVRNKLNEMNLLLVPSVTKTNVISDTIEGVDKYNNVKRTTTYFTEVWMEMTWINAENPDERLSSPWYAQGIDIAGEKGVGKAYTYAEKYFLLKFFNIPTDQDDLDTFQRKYEDAQQKPLNQSPANVTQITSIKATPAQIKSLSQACAKAGFDKEASFTFMDDIVGHHNTGEMTAAEVAKLLQQLPTYKEAVH